MQTKGQHVIADVWLNEWPIEYPNANEMCGFLAEQAFPHARLTVVKHGLHEFGDNLAFTCFWVLAESHFSMHTFPEQNYISMDCYTCGETAMPLAAITEVMKYLDVKDAKITVVPRG